MTRTAVFAVSNRVVGVFCALACLLASQWAVASCTPEPAAPYAARADLVR